MPIDARTGKRCTDFGTNGEVTLLNGMGDVKPGFYYVTSPPTLAKGVAVLGGWVADNVETQEPSGVVRGFDPISGRLLWAWDLGRPDVLTAPPEGQTYTRGTPNAWSVFSADDALGMVYIPTGNATPDYYGGHRTAGVGALRELGRRARCGDRRSALVVPDDASRHLGLRRAVATGARRSARRRTAA